MGQIRTAVRWPMHGTPYANEEHCRSQRTALHFLTLRHDLLNERPTYTPAARPPYTGERAAGMYVQSLSASPLLVQSPGSQHQIALHLTLNVVG